MRTEMVEYKIYKYNELTDDAKEKVKAWYLEGQEAFVFTEMVKEDLYCLFGKNNLEVQYSLASCQGDGFNIYGNIDAETFFKCIEDNRGGRQLEEFKDVLTDKEKKTILHYAEECGDIEIPYNHPYCYSLADYIDIVEDWDYKLVNYSSYSNIDYEALRKFEKLVREVFTELCKGYEKWGYEFFYEIDEDELEEICEANEYEFYEDGTIY